MFSIAGVEMWRDERWGGGGEDDARLQQPPDVSGEPWQNRAEEPFIDASRVSCQRCVNPSITAASASSISSGDGGSTSGRSSSFTRLIT